jgi:autotransporter-associated beta strand protein
LALPLDFTTALAGSATWDQNPTSGDWNTAVNWTPQTVPNSETDVATFGASNVTNLSITNASVSLDSAVFNSGAPSYTLTVQIYNLLFYGGGIVNNSGSVQTILAPTVDDNDASLFFYNSASAGDMTSYSTVGGFIEFFDASSLGSATFDLTSGSFQGTLIFSGTSTAGDATINASASSEVSFLDSSTGGNATLNLSSAAFAVFAESNDAEYMNGNCVGGEGQFSSQIDFEGSSSAGGGTFTAMGGSTSGEEGAFILFDSIATADSATFIINGGMGAGLTGTELFFTDHTTAANANITANGGVDGSDGGVIFFQKQAKGGKASITLNGNSELDISTHNAPGVTIGSLTGVGSVLLGANTLTIGSNNQSTTFSGVIQDSGGLTKTGTGVLTLSGSSTHTGNTTVTGGVLGISNRRGSGTGMGSVNVQAGTLGGKGIISGAVAIGTGSGSGAFLAPAAGTNLQAMLTIQSALTLNADATYAYTFKANRNRARTDGVFASGVIINSGAMIALSGQTQGRLTTGLTLTLISNTSASPISGTFSNLPDGGIVTVNGDNFQASYSGGDGNDLTMTVVP